MSMESKTVIYENDGITAVEKLIALRKLQTPYFSKSYLSKKLGLRSRGYLTDVFKKRKKLSARIAAPLVEQLGLEAKHEALLKKKLMLDTELCKTEEARASLLEEISMLMKNDSRESIAISENDNIEFLSLIYLSFFLFAHNTGQRKDVVKLFGRDKGIVVDRSLHILVQKGVLIKEGSFYRPDENHTPSFLNLNCSTNHLIKYLKSSILEGSEKVNQLKTIPGEVIFNSSVLTVRKKKYLELVAELKNDLNTMHAKLDDSQPDTLVRFNVQIYPLVSHKKESLIC